MPWIRLDDGFADHPKVAAAGPLAGWLHVKAIIYCGRFLTDGVIPRAVVRSLVDWSAFGIYIDVPGSGVGSMMTPDNLVLAGELVKNGAWHDEGVTFRIHDYLDYQPSRADVLAERGHISSVRSEAGRLGGLASAASRSKREANVAANREANAKQNEAPSHSHPDPIPDPNPLPGRPNAAVKRVVDRWRTVAEEILCALNAARKRVNPASRGISSSYDSLSHIAGRLEAGKSAADCLHVVEVCESECRARPDAFRWFDAITPFRPENFERKCAADPTLVGTVPAQTSASIQGTTARPQKLTGGDMTHLLRPTRKQA